MPFSLSDDEQLVQATVRRFAREQVGLETASDLDRHGRFPAQPLAEAASLGLLGVTGPAEAGGAGPTAYALMVHEMAQVCPNTAAVMASHCGMSMRAVVEAMVAAAGEEGDAGTAPDLAPLLAAGEVTAWLSTEEAFGSEKGMYGTTAVRDGDGWVLNGQKVWGVAASDARHYLVTAQAAEGPTLFWVDPAAAGVERGEDDPLMGIRAAGIRAVYLSDVACDRLVGAPGQGHVLEQAALPWCQLGVAAALLGCMAGAAEAAARFAETRVQFQNPIGTFQAVSDGVVAMDVSLAAGRALLLEAAAHLEVGGNEARLWAARAKECAQQAAVPMTRQAIRIQGGTGFMREGGTERFARDARALQFMGEPFAIQRDAIRRQVLDLDFGAAP